MLFRNGDLLADFERLTKGLNFGPEFDKVVEDISTNFAGQSNIDAVRSADRFELFIDLPGVDPSTVDLTVDGRRITITTHRDFVIDEGAELVHAGRRHGAFNRSYQLPEDLDTEQLSARSENGVLIVTVPVEPSGRPRKIQITES